MTRRPDSVPAGAQTPSSSGSVELDATLPHGSAVLASIAEAGPPVCAIDELAAGRVRIVKLLAKGGMGEVYEAEDVELKERIGLKTIRPDLAKDPRALELFRREIQLARRVTHPNVCRIF